MVAAGVLAHYQFWNTYDGGFADVASNTYHALNGRQLSGPASEQVMSTPIGAYFSSTALITLPPTATFPSTIPLTSTFSLMLWVRHLNGFGGLIRKYSDASNHLVVSLMGNGASVTISGVTASNPIPGYSWTTVDNKPWLLICLSVTAAGFSLLTPAGVVATGACSYTNDGTDYFVLGNNGVDWFEGFMYDLYVFDFPLVSTDLAAYYDSTIGGCPFAAIDPSHFCIPIMKKPALPFCGNPSPLLSPGLPVCYNDVCKSCISSPCTPCLYNMCTCDSARCATNHCSIGPLVCHINCTPTDCTNSGPKDCTQCADPNAILRNGECVCDRTLYNSAVSPFVNCAGEVYPSLQVWLLRMQRRWPLRHVH